ncbi:hypothetical protein A2926_02705 [Candidatus Giovannonibacteria bacterium RIFCSPLOWO2_01_FULL_44_40]|uniref:Uncharacterized protein n=1 Tax=Candidatus Giovannonibacteria bacterium RIFCSPHIGHO2_01_FULL_45_23 TaxID=1798325 RepID=A0A1F5VE64_9BACT|nr:MAG: hypothetical protein A2834_00830 [Candidatus Giovannonibacteria bacterium RIFCSPHIGHO2_01_FULL_45_23]OGF75746.1 MAG: hypothetical protein A3C77_02435 [Candidatus Giovannonibacteria bacterium RIFCSPHIGHO2_02_FULL_45_13]OGF79924.1 MAG: hypothetical protein A2926_02705 [Candidatus Giovannonibacteria bacterium RIFCSPLOWO2_01_FULL_44_40]
MLTIWLVLSFTAIAVFGFLAMNADMADHKQGCLAATASGAICPSENMFNIAFFHTNAFKSFSLALEFFAFLILICTALANFSTKTSPLLLDFSPVFKKMRFLTSLERRMTYWLALHENSR